MKVKWQNYGLWVALGALVVMIVADVSNIAPEKAQTYVDIALSILIAAGVVSNPNAGKWFVDKNGDGIPDDQQNIDGGGK